MFPKTSGGGTHDEAGWYTITLDATDTATVGRLQISTDVTGALPTWSEFQVVEQDTYEFLYADGATPDADIAAILSDTTVLVDTRIPDTISLANILAEVNTALDTAISELSQGIPTATPSVRTGIMLMYMALRNKLDVATVATDTLEIHSDDGTRIAQKLLTDDGSDYSEAKMISGA
jgi:hypothetical protein